MIYPIVDPEEWSKIYSLRATTLPCMRCGKQLTTTMPFAAKDLRGLKSEPHGCGEEYDLLVVASKDKKEREAVKCVFQEVSDGVL